MKKNTIVKVVATSSALITILTGCGSSETESNASASPDSDVKKVKIAYDQASKPMS